MSEQHASPSKDLFLDWRAPRRGSANPETLSNPVWAWLVHSRLSAWEANERFAGPSPMKAGPCWCFNRFGQSETALPDGRTIYVAGEHEDYYDPDFYIYNDVVVVGSAGDVAIFAYPTEIFPATDFHSATLVDDSLVLIGNLGYQDARRPGHTQVLQLELDTWKITNIETPGDMPGWIHGHQAELSPTGHEIRISGGEIVRLDEQGFVENIDEWSLDIRTWRWQRLSRRPWTRFTVIREDKGPNHLWEMHQLSWAKKVSWHDMAMQAEMLAEAIGAPPDLDVLATLYAPTSATEIIGADPDDFTTYRIRIGDVVVRYKEDSRAIQVTVEGLLDDETRDGLMHDITRKLSLLEGVPVSCVLIPPETAGG